MVQSPSAKQVEYPRASEKEINALKKLVTRVDKLDRLERGTTVDIPLPTIEAQKPAPAISETLKPDGNGNVYVHHKNRERSELFNGGIQRVEITREPLNIDNPVTWLLMLKPELKPYAWQFEELMRVAGYVTGINTPKVKISKDAPLKMILAAANGSGKDAIYIAAAATWFAVTGSRNRAIITSSSFEQVKFQTEPAIVDLCKIANKRFSKLFKSVQFHHLVPELGSEIKLFATDDAGHAEGYHAFDGGSVMKIVNEAKTVKMDIFEAMSRWTGVTHELVVSSPGRKSGYMYNRVADAILYPQPCVLGKWYLRKVTAYECPHITKASISSKIEEWGIQSSVIRSSIFAEFSDLDSPVVIPEDILTRAFLNPPSHQGSDIGIGLDTAAGGDEDACFVRRGNKVIHKFFFRQPDTNLACDLIDSQLSPWKDSSYVFNADNGGVSQAMVDKLVAKGWRIQRRNNQSPAFNKREFLNLGAEMWFYLKRLIERGFIIIPDVPKLKDQLTTRQFRGFDSTQGKFALQSKVEAKAEGLVSPDRADAFVLCFFSYRPGFNIVSAEKKKRDEHEAKLVDGTQLLNMERSIFNPPQRRIIGRLTTLVEI